MPMSKYNRENPFMYLLEISHDTFVQSCTNAIKSCIIMGILSFISLIGCIATWTLYDEILFIEAVIIIAAAVFISNETIKLASSANADSQSLNQTIYGNEYQNINLNNEKLLAQINSTNKNIGKIKCMINFIELFSITYMIFILYYLVRIMAFFA